MKYNIGDVLKSNSYGEYEIIGYIKSKSYNIKFLKTGFETTVNESKIIKGSITDKLARKCDICGDVDNGIYVSKKYNIILCKKHYREALDRDSVDKIGNRTMFDKNDIVINDEENFAEIILRDKNQNEICRTIIDIENIDFIKNVKWRFSSGRVKGVVGENTSLELHKFLTGNVKEIVDHIDRNPLNNRLSNLRIATAQENVINSSLAKNNTSGYVGVYEQKNVKINKWCSELMLNRIKVHREYFKTKEEAIISRLKAELKYFGKEFAPQRHLFEEYGIL